MAKTKGSTARSSRRCARLALAAGLVVPAVLGNLAQAVVLGSVQVRSHLGQPLVAEVELLDADQDSLKAGIAAPGVHAQHGFQAPHLLGRVDVRMVQKRDGRRVLRLTSERAVNEPTLELLLQAEDRGGGIVRYVPVLLDPAPSYASTPPALERDASTPLPAESVALADAVRPPRAMRLASRGMEPADQLNSPPATRRSRAAKGTDAARPTQASSRRAPKQTADAGAVTAATSRATDTGSAAAATVAMRPAVPTDPMSPSINTSAASAGLNIAAADSTASALADAPLAAASAAAVPAPQALPTASASAPGVDHSATVASANPVPGMERELPAPPWFTDSSWLLGSAGVLAASLLALGLRRRRPPQSNATPPLDAPGDSQLFAGQDESRFPVLSDAPPRGRGTARVARHSSVFSSSAFEMMEDVDPLAEADVYMAYGRADHAHAILEDAIRAHPERAALHLKLLAIHLERRDTLAFAHQAGALAELTGRRGTDWQQAAAMGLRLDPANPLYAQPAAAGHPQRATHADAVVGAARQPAAQAWAGSTQPAQFGAADARPGGTGNTKRPLSDADAPRSAIGPIDFTISSFPSAAVSPTVPGGLTPTTAPPVSPPPAATQDRQVIDFDLSDMDSWPTNARGTSAPTGAATPPAAANHPQPIASPLSKPPARAAIETIVDESTPAANASRFGDLPLKLALLKQLSNAGDPDQAAEMGREVAQLIADLRGAAYQIMAQAQRRA